MRLTTLCVLGVFALAMTCATASAQQGLVDGTPDPPAGWNYHESFHPLTPTQIIQQKAQARAAQRIARLEAQEWYGFSKARPRATATPFTGLYGSQWQGYTYGRPAAWHASRPTILITR